MKLPLLALVILLPGLALAQTDSTTPSTPPPAPAGGGGPMHPPMDPAQQLDHLTTALTLTPDQQAKIKPILQDTYDKATAIFKDTSLSDADKKTQMMALHKDSHTQINALLTPDQQAKMKAMHHHGPPGGGAGGTPPPTQ